MFSEKIPVVVSLRAAMTLSVEETRLLTLCGYRNKDWACRNAVNPTGFISLAQIQMAKNGVKETEITITDYQIGTIQSLLGNIPPSLGSDSKAQDLAKKLKQKCEMYLKTMQKHSNKRLSISTETQLLAV